MDAKDVYILDGPLGFSDLMSLYQTIERFDLKEKPFKPHIITPLAKAIEDNDIFKAIRKGEQPNLEQPLGGGPEVNLRLPALIPEDYLPDVHTRLILYKRIASARTAGDLRELQVEMIDRFGSLPEPTRVLFRATEMKLRATPLGVRKVDLGGRGGRIVFGPRPNVDPADVDWVLATIGDLQITNGAFSSTNYCFREFSIDLQSISSRQQFDGMISWDSGCVADLQAAGLTLAEDKRPADLIDEIEQGLSDLPGDCVLFGLVSISARDTTTGNITLEDIEIGD